MIQHRNKFPKLLLDNNLYGLAAEIGVAEGYFSFNLLAGWPGVLFMIDPWALLPEPGFSPHGAATQADQDARYQRICATARAYHGRAVPLRMTSRAAAAQVPDASLSFCYLDGNHTLPAIEEDLQLWLPKVRPGGILAGHDYLQGLHGGVDYGVKVAVDALAARLRVRLHTTSEPDYPSWFFFKPAQQDFR